MCKLLETDVLLAQLKSINLMKAVNFKEWNYH
jgi:hypothetical protein